MLGVTTFTARRRPRRRSPSHPGGSSAGLCYSAFWACSFAIVRGRCTRPAQGNSEALLPIERRRFVPHRPGREHGGNSARRSASRSLKLLAGPGWKPTTKAGRTRSATAVPSASAGPLALASQCLTSSLAAWFAARSRPRQRHQHECRAAVRPLRLRTRCGPLALKEKHRRVGRARNALALPHLRSERPGRRQSSASAQPPLLPRQHPSSRSAAPPPSNANAAATA